MNRIIIVGSINIDITSYLDQSPKPGETLFADEISISLGGKGANQSIAASRLGISTGIIACVGDDPFALNARTTLEASSVDCHLAVSPDTFTGLATIDVMADGSNSIRIGAGANARLTPEIIQSYKDQITGADIMLLQNEIPLETSLEAARIARGAGTTVLMDPAPAPGEPWSKEILDHFDIITPNGHEVEIITGHQPLTLDDAQSAASDICAHGARGAVVTMGDLGVAWFVNGQSSQHKATPVASIDTVAAGDCFNAAFGVALSENQNYEEAIAFACDVAALATTRKGASESAPTAQEVDTFRKSVQS